MTLQKVKKLKSWYEEHERKISVGSLLSGFVVDALTLQRIDALRENLWIAGNLILVGVCIILLNRGEREGERFWLPNILQFSFGALLGSFFIFYFRSAALGAAWPFMLILLIAMVANELFQKKYERLVFQLSLFYFSLFSFFIFAMPLVTKNIGPAIFILSGGVSLFVLWCYIFVLHYFVRDRFLEARTHIWSFVTVIFVGINLLYFTNLIPPIPLSLKDAGIYHSVEKSLAQDYIVLDEERSWWERLPFRKTVHWVEGEPLFAYTAVWSPGSLNTDIVHEWQYRNSDGEWITATRIPLYLAGGRSGGFRMYSRKFSFTPGDWRVDVKTPYGALIGRVNFKIVRVTSMPDLNPVVKK